MKSLMKRKKKNNSTLCEWCGAKIISSVENSRNSFKGLINLLSINDGGIHVPIFSGHKSLVLIDNTKVQCELSLLNSKMLLSGQSSEVLITLSTTVVINNEIELDLFEGTRKIGTCKVLN